LKRKGFSGAEYRGRNCPIIQQEQSWNRALAQQTTGVPGSPRATTTIDGKYLPPPPPAFGGVIDLGAEQSKPF
jgi:hypothetical protein